MSELSAFRNRLVKNNRHWKKWARRRGISCFRLYDRDIPEFPWAIDWYQGHVHAQEFARQGQDAFTGDEQLAFTDTLCSVLEIEPTKLALKTRQRQRGSDQYQKTGRQGEEMVVEESGLKFLINLHRYLDTGLFIDHRQTRQMVRERAQNKRVLNLFAYTGSFSVYAAAGGARESVTVDLSNTYQAWSRRNFELNGMDLEQHQLIRADVLVYLAQLVRQRQLFDIIVMDPPSFSNSKRMENNLDVQRDHSGLIHNCLKLLRPSGSLFFSNNLRRFKLDAAIEQAYSCENITAKTIPEDFKRHRPHQCWLIKP
ncbi:MAG: class I SAM-dependent methyltransferase [Chromatiales bacterium]|nr:class I SAM-dependent methyltransferase [Chromatiales bacterium]